jgi:deoxyadenosine/deoxycytidine kinase
MNSSRFIAVEGCIGVGKTTLARKVADRYKARLILEPVEENPFLENFYKDPQKWAFQTQLHFLFTRYSQLHDLRQQDLFSATTVSDYIFEKDRVFAYLNLSDWELDLYEKIFSLLNPVPVRPDLVIYLEARLDVLVNRVRRRDRPCERPLKTAYLERLIEAYNEFFFRWTDTPLLVVNTNDIDFVKSEADFEQLIAAIDRTRHGTEHFHPVPRR